jgi:hypothetical protein
MRRSIACGVLISRLPSQPIGIQEGPEMLGGRAELTIEQRGMTLAVGWVELSVYRSSRQIRRLSVYRSGPAHGAKFAGWEIASVITRRHNDQRASKPARACDLPAWITPEVVVIGSALLGWLAAGLAMFSVLR